MPSAWIDHAADPVEPRLYRDVPGNEEDITPFSEGDKGCIHEVLLFTGEQTPAQSGIYIFD